MKLIQEQNTHKASLPLLLEFNRGQNVILNGLWFP